MEHETLKVETRKLVEAVKAFTGNIGSTGEFSICKQGGGGLTHTERHFLTDLLDNIDLALARCEFLANGPTVDDLLDAAEALANGPDMPDAGNGERVDMIAGIVYKIRAYGLINEDQKPEYIGALVDYFDDADKGNEYITHHHNHPVEHLVHKLLADKENSR